MISLEDWIYFGVIVTLLGLIIYAVWWGCSRAYYYFLYGSLDPILREKD